MGSNNWTTYYLYLRSGYLFDNVGVQIGQRTGREERERWGSQNPKVKSSRAGRKGHKRETCRIGISIGGENVPGDEELEELAERIRDNTEYDEIIIAAGNNEQQRVAYGYTRENYQTLREILGTIDMVSFLMLYNHFEGVQEAQEEPEGWLTDNNFR